MIPVLLNQTAYAGYQAQSLDTGTWVSGLTSADFTLSLWRESGGGLIAATETITLTEVDATDAPGFYEISFTPVYSGAYLLKVTPTFTAAAGGESRYAFAVSSVALVSGSDYATLAQLKSYLGGIEGSADDTILTECIAYAQTTIDEETGRSFLQRAVSWDLDGEGCSEVVLPDFPVTLSAVYETTDVPRVYDSTTLLTADEDYVYDSESGIIYRLNGTFASGVNTLRAVGVAGSATVLVTVTWCCIRIAGLYYRGRTAGGLSGYSTGDGSVTRFDHDRLPIDVLMKLAKLRATQVS